MFGMLYSSIDRQGKDLAWEGPFQQEHMRLTGPPWIAPGKASSCFISSFHFQEWSFPKVIFEDNRFMQKGGFGNKRGRALFDPAPSFNFIVHKASATQVPHSKIQPSAHA
jgi:hypothetical protein